MVNGTTPQTQVSLDWGIRIPLRDGISLNGILYRPKDQSEPLPAVVMITPYMADTYHATGYYFAQQGYASILVDCRGRGSSEGDFEPFIQEAKDGYDVIEWMAAQRWCSGKVGMWGCSYMGYNQWAAAKEFPPHLVTIIPAASGYPGVDLPIGNNILTNWLILWSTVTSGKTLNMKLGTGFQFWNQKYQDLYFDPDTPFKDLDKLVGNTTTQFQNWVAHPHRDEYWDSMVPTADELSAINIPILTITGHYDGDQPGALEHYRQHMEYASKKGQDNHYLLIGPWDHAGICGEPFHSSNLTLTEFGGLTFGEASVLELRALYRQWFDWTMKDGEKPQFLKKRVTYYCSEAEAWRYKDRFEEIVDHHHRFYLGSTDGQANDVFHSGTLSDQEPDDAKPDTYIYDPLDDRHALFGNQSLTDQRAAYNLFEVGLVYQSDPFEEAFEISGFPKFVAWISMDVPDTDFDIALYEILADGSSVVLSTTMQRARYRDSMYVEKPVPENEIIRYTFDRFNFFSRRVATQSRLRLVIRAPNSIFLEKNYNSGGVVAEETGEDARTAHINLHHDPEHPSFLELPIGLHDGDG